ncbi:unnamed protein product [Trichogramma brassicae]|uniref:Uncharacterized protein n=1 Tax=Trichogramma brassicae TaxID=86971 RepID=A0A6H5IMU0_9HYME|nr:unnamed protein product [Trichogramma brassicae]
MATMPLALVLLLLLQLSSCARAARPEVVVAQFHDEQVHRMNHLVVDKNTGRVYVGAVNRLYQLSPDLNLVVREVTGPKNDSTECSMIDCPESMRKLLDNVNKALVIDYTTTRLISCGHVRRAQSAQHLGRGAGGQGARGGQQRHRLDGGLHRPGPAQSTRLPGHVRRRHVHRQLALPLRGPRGELQVARSRPHAQHRRLGGHHGHPHVRQLAVARALPNQLHLRLQQRGLQLLPHDTAQVHEHRSVHLETGARLPRRSALLLLHGDTDRVHVEQGQDLQPRAGRLHGQGGLGAGRRPRQHAPGRRAVRRVRRERQPQQQQAQEPVGPLRLLAQGHQAALHEQHTEVLQRRGRARTGLHIAESQLRINVPFSRSIENFHSSGAKESCLTFARARVVDQTDRAALIYSSRARPVCAHIYHSRIVETDFVLVDGLVNVELRVLEGNASSIINLYDISLARARERESCICAAAATTAKERETTRATPDLCFPRIMEYWTLPSFAQK